MTNNQWFSLFDNIELLISLSLISLLSINIEHKINKYGKYLIGILFGFIGILIMTFPYKYAVGITFDTRSILLCLVAMFFGTIPTVIVTTMILLYRLYIGGSGLVMGVLVILSSAIIGLIWRKNTRNSLLKRSWLSLYLLGLVVHITEIICMFVLPNEMILPTIKSIGVPVLIVYPVITMIIGKLMSIPIIYKENATLTTQSEIKFRSLFSQAQIGICYLNSGFNYVEMNQKFCDMLGYSKEELTGFKAGEITYKEDSQLEQLNIARIRNKEVESYTMDKRYIKKDGTLIWCNLTISTLTFGVGSLFFYLGVIIDISERKLAELHLAENEARLRAITDVAQDAILVMNPSGYITFWNPAAERIFGYSITDIVSKKFHDLVAPTQYIEAHNEAFASFKQNGFGMAIGKTLDFQAIRQDRKLIDVQLSLSSLNIDGEWHSVGIVRDITEKKRAEENIVYLSYHDYLTELYNRRFFEEELIRLDTERNYPLTIVMGDVNNLKMFNDSLGHQVGDDILRKVAKVFKKAFRSDDIIARLGGDEFVVLLPKTDAIEVEKIIERFRNELAKESVGNIGFSVSIGYDIKTKKDQDVQTLLKNAENFMYQHKMYDSASLKNRTIELIMKTLFEKSNREMLHSARVSEICEMIATSIGLNKDEVNKIRVTGLMHDIGKIGVDEKILNSNTKLSDFEWSEIKKHPEAGFRILNGSVEFHEIANDVLQHHERWDGNGYPKGLKGEEISINARIIAIADTYDALVSDRAYRKAYSKEYAINEIIRCSGTQFDPELVKVFIECIK